MGNCLALQENVIKVMKPDGNILEYKAPIRVQQILSDFSGHAISNPLRSSQYLLPDAKLLGGHFYNLVPLQLPSPKIKKKVRFSIPEKEDGHKNGVVSIKLVITKQELQEMLQKGGVSVDDLLFQLQGRQRIPKVDTSMENDGCWKPVLESIPEID